MNERPDDDSPGLPGNGPAEMPEQTRVDLVELLATELRRAWTAAVADGADPEELRRLMEERRKALEDDTDDPDG